MDDVIVIRISYWGKPIYGRPCASCGKMFEMPSASRIAKGGGRYCGRACAVKGTFAASPEERFWAMVNKSGPVPAHAPELGPCWVWTGHCNRYGSFGLGRKIVRAHRFSWELAHGPIPDGLCVLHKCDNPPCTNPGHLFLGTQLDNARDRDRKGRLNSRVGERNPKAKLTETEVLAIRAEYVPRYGALRAIARKYGVTPSAIRWVVSEGWKSVQR